MDCDFQFHNIRFIPVLQTHVLLQCVPLANEPDIYLIILTPMKILQRNFNRITFVM